MKAIIYARVSTVDKQDHTRQVNELQDILKKHGYSSEDIEVFAESVSGYNKTERHQLDAMLSKVEASPKNYTIYVSEISRLGRNPITTRQIIDRLTEIGVPVYIQSLNQFTIQNGDRNMIMNIILQVLLEYANLESQTTKERSKQGLRQSALNGKAGGGLNIPYGYRKDENGKLVIDNDEKRVIERIFELYATSRNGIKVISNVLNEDRVPTRVNKAFAKPIKFKTYEKDSSKVRWSDKTIHDILRNTIYVGKRKYKGEVIEAPQLAMIPRKLFDACNDVMKSKTHSNHLTKYTFIFKDLITCGVCGRNYYGKYKPHKVTIDRHGKKKDAFENYYMCSSALCKGGGCKNGGINTSLIESAIFEQATSPTSINDFLDSNNTMKADLEADIKKLQQTVKLDTATLNTKGKEKDRLLDIYLSDCIPKKVFEERQMKINFEVEALNGRIAGINKTLVAKSRALGNLGNGVMNRRRLESFRNDRSQMQTFIKQRIKNIVVTKVDQAYSIASIEYSTFKLGNYKVYNLFDLKGLRMKPCQYRYKSGFLKGKVSVKSFDDFEWRIFDDLLTVE